MQVSELNLCIWAIPAQHGKMVSGLVGKLRMKSQESLPERSTQTLSMRPFVTEKKTVELNQMGEWEKG